MKYLLSVFVLFALLPGIVYAQEQTASPSAKPNTPVIVQAPQTPINLSVSPISLSIETDPGVAVQNEIRIRNNSTSAEQLQISVGTFEADSTGENPRLLDAKPTDTFLTWLKVTNEPFFVNPGEWKTIPVEFVPPSDASLSYYYTIMVKRTSEVDNADGKAVVAGVPAILVLATVNSPNAVRQIEVESFVAKKAIVEYLPQEFEVTLRNTGNVHIKPIGNIFIDGQGKKDLGILSLNPGLSSILPNTARTFTVSFADGFPVYAPVQEGEKDVQVENGEQARKLTWDFSKADRFRFGKFTAHLLMVYDNGERDIPVESYVSFWVIPWKFILIGLLLAAVLLFGLYSIVRAIIRVVKPRPQVVPPSSL